MASILFITNSENWKIVKTENIMGIDGIFGTKLFSKIKKTDKCVIYVTKKIGFKGVFEIISKIPNKKIKWNTGRYRYLIQLNPIIIPKKPLKIEDYLENLKFIKNKQYYGLHLQYEKFIPDEDLNFIIKIMKNQ